MISAVFVFRLSYVCYATVPKLVVGHLPASFRSTLFGGGWWWGLLWGGGKGLCLKHKSESLCLFVFVFFVCLCMCGCGFVGETLEEEPVVLTLFQCQTVMHGSTAGVVHTFVATFKMALENVKYIF